HRRSNLLEDFCYLFAGQLVHRLSPLALRHRHPCRSSWSRRNCLGRLASAATRTHLGLGLSFGESRLQLADSALTLSPAHATVGGGPSLGWCLGLGTRHGGLYGVDHASIRRLGLSGLAACLPGLCLCLGCRFHLAIAARPLAVASATLLCNLLEDRSE